MAKPPASPTRFLAAVFGMLLLTRVSLGRLCRSRQTLICVLLLAFAGLAVIGWSLHPQRGTQAFVSELVLPMYVSFLLPMFCLSYASPVIAGDCEDQTLVYLLATPLPRSLVFAAKYAAALALSLVWTLGTWTVLTQLAGPCGREVFRPFCPAVFWSSLAYVGLFTLFSALLRRATIVALVYALFLETFLGNVPGVVKRVAISFYTECLMLDAGARLGLHPTAGREPTLLVPVSGDTAGIVLGVLAVAFFVTGLCLFARREYA
jgi:ABC-type transport system involved in multi-copper enzyme maturation permease subunit